MKLAASAIALAVLASGASAQQFNGAEITGSYGLRTDGTNSNFTSGHGSVEYGFGNFSLQADLGAFGWSDESEIKTTVIAHGIYNVSDTFAVGAFVGYENWPNTSPVDWLDLGVEAKYTFSGMPVVIEAYYLNNNELVTPATPYEFFTLSAQYSVSENIALTGGYTYHQRGSYTDDTGMLAAEYTLANGISISGEYARNFDTTTDIVTLSVSKSFGGGVTFGIRDWTIGRGI